MNSIRRHRTAIVTAASAAALAPLAFVPQAFAADNYSCGEGDGILAPGNGVCWVVASVGEDGQSVTGEFTAPAGVETVTALLVGGGGGAYLSGSDDIAYGGGAGEVLLYDSVPSTSPISYEIGSYGYYDYDTDGPLHGGDTSIEGFDNAEGGFTATLNAPGDSGNENMGVVNDNLQINNLTAAVGGGGGSAAGAIAATSGTFPDIGKGGAGTTWESLNSPLFDSSVPEALYGYEPPPLARGGSVFAADPETEGGMYIPSPGDGGFVLNFEEAGEASALPGSPGVIVFAWYAEGYPLDQGDDSSGLPETGSPVQPWTVAGALAAMLAGAVALTRRRERV